MAVLIFYIRLNFPNSKYKNLYIYDSMSSFANIDNFDT